jgi:hypothetical protein
MVPVMLFTLCTLALMAFALAKTWRGPMTAVGWACVWTFFSAIVRGFYFWDLFHLYERWPYTLERIWWELPFILTHLAYPVLLTTLISAALILKQDLHKSKWFQEKGRLWGFLFCLVVSIIPLLTNRIVEAVRWYSLDPTDFAGQVRVFATHNRVACFIEFATWWVDTGLLLLIFFPMTNHLRSFWPRHKKILIFITVLLLMCMMFSLGGIAIGTLLLVLNLESYPSGYLAYNATMNAGCAFSQLLLAFLLFDHRCKAHETYMRRAEPDQSDVDMHRNSSVAGLTTGTTSEADGTGTLEIE